MSIAARLTWWFATLLVVALLLVIGLAYHEMVLEAANPQAWGEEPEPLWWQVGEVVLRALIPLSVLGVGGWWLTLRALRPLQTLTDAARRIHSGNLRETVPTRGTDDEIDRLTAVFNDMTARLARSFDQISEFTLHASHELKTPLAILRADFGELVDEPGRSEADRERFASHLEEIERLTRIVNGLTLLAKADAQQLALERQPLRLDELVTEAAEDARALGEPAGLQIATDIAPHVEIMGDRHRLRQLLLILCDNAVKYNRPDGEIALSLAADTATATVHVRNTGPGIPHPEQPHVFQRFYRGSTAPASDIEGCGLGLAIARLIVQAHRGDLSFSSTSDRTEFVLSLPLARSV